MLKQPDLPRDMSQFMLVLLVVAVLLPLGAAKLLLDYRERSDRRRGEVTLSVGELERLIRRYVEEATAPLEKRIRSLEADQKQGEERGDQPLRDPAPLIDDPSLESDDRDGGHIGGRGGGEGFA